MNVTCPHCRIKQETDKQPSDLIRCESCKKVWEIPVPIIPKIKKERTTIDDDYDEDFWEKNEKKSKIKKSIVKLIIIGVLGTGTLIILNKYEQEKIARENAKQAQLLRVSLPPPEPPRPLTREEKIWRQFRNGKGSEHIKLTQLVKSSMHDPSSFEHIMTIMSDGWNTEDDDFSVIMQFRGRNQFGALVINQVTAFITIEEGKIKMVHRDK